MFFEVAKYIALTGGILFAGWYIMGGCGTRSAEPMGSSSEHGELGWVDHYPYNGSHSSFSGLDASSERSEVTPSVSVRTRPSRLLEGKKTTKKEGKKTTKKPFWSPAFGQFRELDRLYSLENRFDKDGYFIVWNDKVKRTSSPTFKYKGEWHCHHTFDPETTRLIHGYLDAFIREFAGADFQQLLEAKNTACNYCQDNVLANDPDKYWLRFGDARVDTLAWVNAIPHQDHPSVLKHVKHFSQLFNALSAL